MVLSATHLTLWADSSDSHDNDNDNDNDNEVFDAWSSEEGPFVKRQLKEEEEMQESRRSPSRIPKFT